MRQVKTFQSLLGPTCFFFLLSFSLAGALFAEDGLTGALRGVLVSASRNSKITAVEVYNLTNHQRVYSRDSKVAVKPASVQKIFISLLALQQLGPSYQFSTKFYGEPDSNGWIGRLYVRPSGDPSLVIENLWLAIRELKKRGVVRVGEIIFLTPDWIAAKKVSGARAFEAGSSLMALNFNSSTFTVCPATQENHFAKVFMDPYELPHKFKGHINTLGRKKLAKFSLDPVWKKDHIEINLAGYVGLGSNCFEVYRAFPEPNRYLSSVMEGMLRNSGIKVLEGASVMGKEPSSLPKEISSIKSKPLALILRDLNHYSNNFIADQLAHLLRPEPGLRQRVFDRSNGLEMIEAFVGRFCPKNIISIDDASGLSHSNRICAHGLMEALIEGMQDAQFSVEFLGSLPVGNKSGTLQRRFVGYKDMTVRAKTGSIDGVSSLAGLVNGRTGNQYLFVIIENGVGSVALAKSLEEKIVKTIHDLG